MKKQQGEQARRALDGRLTALSADAIAVPVGGWLRAIREALGMTRRQLGDRLGVAPQSVAALERSELRGTARLDSLRKAAAALDCRLVYAIVPGTPLEDMVRGRELAVALRDQRRVAHSMALEAQPVDDKPDVADRICYARRATRPSELWDED